MFLFPSQKNRLPHGQLTTEQRFLNDMHKIQTAEKYGYSVIIVWEDDKNKLDNCINKIIKNIYEKNI